jgi:GNAT superfamily N-acetyltransferase
VAARFRCERDMQVRPAAEGEVELLARIWHAGWHDAHAQIVPAELTQIRTLQSFGERLRAALAEVRVIGPLGAPAGFYILRTDELYQFYVAAEWRGTGVAGSLISDAEAELSERGIEKAWLACAIGNERAAKFYVKQGWKQGGTMLTDLETPHGIFSLRVWRYEKILMREA